MKVLNSVAFFAGLDKEVEQVRVIMRTRVRRLVDEAMRRLIEKTPVNTGQAVMNYVATGGSPYAGAVKDAPDPVEPTNHLPLGAERLRGPVAAVATATIATVDFSDIFKTFYITNNSPHIVGLEHGALPASPYTPRSPQGMFGVSVQELEAMLASGRV